MSSSLQYSNYTGTADFVIPYELLEAPRDIQSIYLRGCRTALQCYDRLCESGINPDAAGYTMPQGLRNAIIICATPFQWKHMISQRTCRRNTHEMRIVMLLICQNLYDFSSSLFAPETTGPVCQKKKCLEGKMACGNPIDQILLPGEILRRDYPLLFGADVYLPYTCTLQAGERSTRL